MAVSITERPHLTEHHRSTEPFDAEQEQGGDRWATVLGGAALVGSAVLALYAARDRSWRSIGLAVAGGAPLLYRGATGHWVPRTIADRGEPLTVETSVTVNRSREELYRFWRQLENLPSFMKHLDTVEDLGDGRSRWVAESPVGKRVEWEAVIIEEREGHLISWRSVPGSQLETAGSVLFEDAPGGRGTVVRVSMEYRPRGFGAGRALARLLAGPTQQEVKEDLRRFKQLMEAGEVPTTWGQPTGERSALHMRNPL